MIKSDLFTIEERMNKSDPFTLENRVNRSDLFILKERGNRSDLFALEKRDSGTLTSIANNLSWVNGKVSVEFFKENYSTILINIRYVDTISDI